MMAKASDLRAGDIFLHPNYGKRMIVTEVPTHTKISVLIPCRPFFGRESILLSRRQAEEIELVEQEGIVR